MIMLSKVPKFKISAPALALSWWGEHWSYDPYPQRGIQAQCLSWPLPPGRKRDREWRFTTPERVGRSSKNSDVPYVLNFLLINGIERVIISTYPFILDGRIGDLMLREHFQKILKAKEWVVKNNTLCAIYKKFITIFRYCVIHFSWSGFGWICFTKLSLQRRWDSPLWRHQRLRH